MHRKYCCFCIPYRFAVCIFSILALAIGGASLWSILRIGITDSTTKIAAYVATGIYLFLGLSGLSAVFFKRYALAKNFSVLWWTVTILATILSIANAALLATREKDDVRAICRSTLLRELGTSDPTLEEDVDACYKYVLIVSGTVTAVDVLIMIIGGIVASGYTREVKHRMDGLIPPVQAYGQVKPEPLLQPAHPYTHIGKH
ncbi:hypothetical protein BGZ65_001024 [Modicella reniformis]|uniref:Uncharacterized protein n=1 Tax=Modicella reniformis TaxID=1440133 RepID=A0A9P6MA54_9FUNG|nr:hypothetical protein BGZ65_001024 [Modicella reniformis]